MTTPTPLPPHYALKLGSSLDRSLLLRFLQQTYQELCPQAYLPQAALNHLANTTEQYFSRHTPLWWVEWFNPNGRSPSPSLLEQVQGAPPKGIKVGCLWMGHATDQCHGDRHSHIFLLYVAPQHRRQGLGRVLMETATQWSQQQGYRQITLQVFYHNTIALHLYQSLGYETQALTLVKKLEV
jgi:ribosomal protein S18 acetylase RimI-like enzyme